MLQYLVIGISIISVLTAIFMPIMLGVVKRNAKNNDDKLLILYNGQEKTLEAISDMKLSLNDNQNKAMQNYGSIRELKAATKEKFENVYSRLDRQGDMVLLNKEKIDKIGLLQENCPAKNIKQ